MRKNDQRGDHIKKFREDHYPSQKAFADALGLGQSVVSAWERGDNVPSSEAWVKIASVAPSPDNLWFLRQAGLDREIIKAAAKALGESILLRPKEGETVQIPRFRETEAGREEAGPPIPLPAEFIPNPLSTVCLLVDSKVTGITRSDKALFILDESESHTTNLSPFWNRVVFARYRPESQTQRDPHAPPGIYMGRIGFVQPTEPNAEMIFWAVGRLSLLGAKQVGLPLVVARFEYDARGELRGIDADYARALEDPRIPSVRAKARERALEELRLAPGWSILGRVLGRFHLKGVENG